MKSYKLSFGSIAMLSSNMAELIIDEGIEVDEVMVDEYHDFIRTYMDNPCFVLVNKEHSYSFKFEAQRMIHNIKQIKAIAVCVKTSGALMMVETIINLNKVNDWNIKVFQNRMEAMNWLSSQ
ncbi:hypothetical protein [Snuella lapsa]|uniref:DUF7793 domain-containing protein n=1 Tax=Snuella lapsa TaxID=870481 RepID=A0ABP6YCH4_9FLAO